MKADQYADLVEGAPAVARRLSRYQDAFFDIWGGRWLPEHWRETVEFWFFAGVPLSVVREAADEADRPVRISNSRWALCCALVGSGFVAARVRTYQKGVERQPCWSCLARDLAAAGTEVVRAAEHPGPDGTASGLATAVPDLKAVLVRYCAARGEA